jgi:hypothetical protein
MARLLALLAAAAACGCHSLWPDDDLFGDGDLVEVRPPVAAFSGIDVTNSFAVDVRIGPPEVVMTLDRNIVDAGLVVLEVRDGILVVDQCAGCRDFAPTAGAALRITAPIVDTIRARGQVAVAAQATAAEVSIEASGDSHLAIACAGVARASVVARDAAAVDLSGSLPELTAHASGEATLRSRALGNAAEVSAIGGSRVAVHASGSAHVYARGESAVTVTGAPPDRIVDVADAAVVQFP